MTRIWLITGCSTGLGRELAQVAARHGDHVYGTLRKPAQIADFEALAPGKLTGLLMDVTHDAQVEAGVKQILEAHGRLDVLVNNAGYGSLGPVETVPQEEVQRQFEVNVFGPLRLMRAVLPHMRAQHSGHVLNITSIAGLQGYPGVGVYNGSKFALEGIGEALAAEVKHLGIKVINVEPGPFRTDWAGRSATFTRTEIEDYAGSASKNMESIAGVSGKQSGDPAKAADAMYTLTTLEEPPMHQLLGKPAYHRYRSKLRELQTELARFEYLSLPTDFD